MMTRKRRRRRCSLSLELMFIGHYSTFVLFVFFCLLFPLVIMGKSTDNLSGQPLPSSINNNPATSITSTTSVTTILTRIICEGDQLQLSCDSSSRIVIYHALFGIMGRSRLRVLLGLPPLSCHQIITSPMDDSHHFSTNTVKDGDSTTPTSCRLSSVTPAIVKHCQGKRRCTLIADKPTLVTTSTEINVTSITTTTGISSGVRCPEDQEHSYVSPAFVQDRYGRNRKFNQLKVRYSCASKSVFKSMPGGKEVMGERDDGGDAEQVKQESRKTLTVTGKVREEKKKKPDVPELDLKSPESDKKKDGGKMGLPMEKDKKDEDEENLSKTQETRDNDIDTEERRINRLGVVDISRKGVKGKEDATTAELDKKGKGRTSSEDDKEKDSQGDEGDTKKSSSRCFRLEDLFLYIVALFVMLFMCVSLIFI